MASSKVGNLEYFGQLVIADDIYALASFPASYETFPVTQSQTQGKDVQHDPLKRPEQHGKPDTEPKPALPLVPSQNANHPLPKQTPKSSVTNADT